MYRVAILFQGKGYLKWGKMQRWKTELLISFFNWQVDKELIMKIRIEKEGDWFLEVP